jgi:tetratricopeptide (TPR) repeat protein
LHGSAAGILLLWAFAAAAQSPAPATTGAPDPKSADREATRATMRDIFESIRVLLPLSVRTDAFAAPENRATVERALVALEQNADALAEHARSDDPARRLLGGSLSTDAGQALLLYRSDQFEEAAFQVQQTTENCVACHTKLRGVGDTPVARHFVDKSALRGLPLAERARLEVATRQFDEAVGSYEKLLASPKIHAGDLLGPLSDYLTLMVRVENDYARARKTLDRFAKRPDLWRHLRSDVEQWSRALRELEPYRDLPPDLASARGLIDRARQLQVVPADRGGWIHYLVASSLLQRYLALPPPTTRDTAETYYLLGLCETHIGDRQWISQADLYLESAIRLAPKEPFAAEAYVLLEEDTLVGYTGSSGANLPDSVAKHLEELRVLVDH